MRITVILLFISIILACKNDIKETVLVEKIPFNEIQSTYIKERCELDPRLATYLKVENYNDKLIPYTQDYIDSAVNWAEKKLSDLNQVDYFTLSDSEKIDFQTIKNDLNSSIFWNDKIKNYTWNAKYYNIHPLFMATINGKESLTKKLYNVNERLKVAPKFFKVGQQNLITPSKESTIGAIKRIEIDISILEKVIKDSISVSSLSLKQKDEYLDNLDKAINSQLDFANFLKDKLANKESEFRSFRIGKELYPDFFKSSISNWIDEKQTNDIAILYKDEVKEKMEKITLKLWGKYFPNEPIPEINKATRLLMVKICKENPIHLQNIDSINNLLNYNIDFINNNKILSHPKNNIPKIFIEEVSTNSKEVNLSLPKDLDGIGITQLPVYNIEIIKDYSAYKEDLYYTRFNTFTLELITLNIIPGYYSKYLHSPKDVSDIESLFKKASNKNAWSIYAQHLIVTNELYKKQQKDELLLIHYKNQLKMICNAIITYQVHTNDWTKEQVITLLSEDAFMGIAEIEDEWESLTNLGSQLTGSFNGFIEILRLRDEIKILEGEFFTLQRYNEELLSYGYVPLEIIRELMISKYKNQNYSEPYTPIYSN